MNGYFDSELIGLRIENESLRRRLHKAQRWLVVFLIVAVTLILGIGAVAVSLAPAQAQSEHPTPVTFAAVHGVPTTVKLKDTMPDGDRVRQRLGQTIEHPETVCPPNRYTRLTWSYKKPGTTREVYREKPGACTRPGPGPVYVEVWKVGAVR